MNLIFKGHLDNTLVVIYILILPRKYNDFAKRVSKA